MALPIIFVTSFLVALSGAASPGPVLTVVISETLKHKAKAGFLMIVGHSLLELVIVAALIFGLRGFLKNETVVRTVGILGGAFLLVLSFNILRGSLTHQTSFNLEEEKKKSSKIGSTSKGILVSLSNPYWTLWWLTIGANYVFLSLKRGLAGLSFFYTGHILADFAWYGLVIFAVTSSRQIVSDSVYRGILIACGIFLGLLGLCFILGVKIF